ncbi:NfrA family protein [Arsukibacterium indicum]|uniref:Bacteriophage N4 adsorption protein A C-terminal domain-containing protein n=1 Tax=Arsukibacterium indicum TaxID=2848612 RepID=A0ABS6MNA6_9GAMM|nr:hypothetical protein [Arsukibacterium indicum]MBV2130293.1 hypothetical protein [Arsukibacterium indicum]
MKWLSIVFLLLISCAAFSAQDWRNGLTELQQFRTYPYVDKAFVLQQQKHFAAAADELEKALKVVPGHPPLLSMLFDIQLAIPDTAGAFDTYQLMPTSETGNRLLRLLQTELELQQTLAINDYTRLLAVLPKSEQQPILQIITQHLFDAGQLQQAFELLLAQTDLSDMLLLQRAELASQLSLPLQVISDTSAVSVTNLTGTDWLRYSLALVSQGEHHQAAQFANMNANADWAELFYRQWLQIQLSEADWAGAEQSFSWLSRHASLTPAEQLQRFQSAINSENTAFARQLIPQLQASCLDKVTMYLQTGGEKEARETFLTCSYQQSLQWLNYADRWLDADKLEAVTLNNQALADKQKHMVLQKRIAAKDYAVLLRRKFEQPLRRQDYPLLIDGIQSLTDTSKQLKYLMQLYQAMPDDDLLDQLSYRLVLQQQYHSALEILEQGLPFSNAVIQEGILPERLLNLLRGQSEEKVAEVLHKLQDWPILKAARAELWRIAGHCTKAEEILAPAPVSAEGWKTLALCARNNQPGAAIQYWQQAYQLQPDLTYLKEIAYLYQELQQPAQALITLQQVPESQLFTAEILTMAELALQSGTTDIVGHYLNLAQPEQPAELARKSAIQAALYSQQGLLTASQKSWMQATALQPDNMAYQLGYAYALAKTEPEQALKVMAKVKGSGYKFSATDQAQLAFLNQRLSRLTETAESVESALYLYKNQSSLTDVELETQFNLVRLQQQLRSHWLVTTSATLSSGAVMAERLVSDTSVLSRHGTALKAEYFIDPMQRDLSVYALIASNGNGSPWQNFGQQLGISYKPVSSLNLWLTAGLQQYPVGEGNWQELFRVTADTLNNAPWQAEWRPIHHQWWERKVYFDAVWWPGTDSRLVQLRYDHGKVWKLNTQTAQAIKWYGLSQFDYRRQASEQASAASGNQLAAGMGWQWRFWSGQAPVLLDRQRFEVNVEWQYQLAGDLNQRQHALLLQLYVAW